jgi:hypothetical protein
MNSINVKHPLAIAGIGEREGVPGFCLGEERGLDGNRHLLRVRLIAARHQPNAGGFGYLSQRIATAPGGLREYSIS